MDPFETPEEGADDGLWADAWWLEEAAIAEYEAWLAELAEAGDHYGEEG